MWVKKSTIKAIHKRLMDLESEIGSLKNATSVVVPLTYPGWRQRQPTESISVVMRMVLKHLGLKLEYYPSSRESTKLVSNNGRINYGISK